MKTAAAAIGSFALIIALLYCFVAAAAFNLDFYAVEYGKYNIAESINIKNTELMTVTAHMIGYLKDDHDKLQTLAVVAGEKREFFSKRELDHMVDVKNLFIIGNKLGSVSFLIFVSMLAAVLLIKGNLLSNLRLLAKVFCWTVAALVSILAILYILVSLNFDQAFTIFHEIFFSNELWLLDPETELLINIVPLEFFMDIAKRIANCFILSLLTVSLGSLVFLRLVPSNPGHGS